jgi:hypothetical protein
MCLSLETNSTPDEYAHLAPFMEFYAFGVFIPVSATDVSF